MVTEEYISKIGVPNLENTADITGYGILCLCYVKANGPVTNELNNRYHAWDWLQVKDYLWQNFFKKCTKTHTALAVLEGG